MGWCWSSLYKIIEEELGGLCLFGFFVMVKEGLLLEPRLIRTLKRRILMSCIFFFVIIIIKSKKIRPFDAITFYVRLIVGLIIIVSNESYFARVE